MVKINGISSFVSAILWDTNKSCEVRFRYRLKLHWIVYNDSFKSINMEMQGTKTKQQKRVLNSKNQFEPFPFAISIKWKHIYRYGIEWERQHNNNKENDLCKQFIFYFCCCCYLVSAFSIQRTQHWSDCVYMFLYVYVSFYSSFTYAAQLEFNSQKRSVVVDCILLFLCSFGTCITFICIRLSVIHLGYLSKLLDTNKREMGKNCIKR